MAKDLDEKALAIAAGTVSGAGMLLLGLLANIGIYEGAAQQMMRWHMFFGLGPLGILTGIIEAAVMGFVGGWVLAWIYNTVKS